VNVEGGQAICRAVIAERAAVEQGAHVAWACVVVLESPRWLPAHAGAAQLEGAQSQRKRRGCHAIRGKSQR
jgi:hypothetical protein